MRSTSPAAKGLGVREPEAAGKDGVLPILDALPVGLYTATPDGEFRYANPALARAFGYAAPEALLAAGSSALFVDPQQRRDLLAQVQSSDGRPMRIQSEARRSDGSTCWVCEVVRGRVDEDGRLVGLEGALIESCEHRRAEEELRRHEEQLERLVAQRTAELSQANKNLRIQRDLGIALMEATDVDEALRLILEAALRIDSIDAGGIYVVEEATGDLVLRAWQGIKPRFVEHYARVHRDSPEFVQIRAGLPVYRQVDSLDLDTSLMREEELRCVASIPVLHEGRFLACLNVGSRHLAELPEMSRDTLEALAARLGGALARILARGALQASERLFRTLADTIPAPVTIVQGERICYVNQAAAEILACPVESLLGASVLEFVHPDMREIVRSRLAARQAGQPAPARYEVCVVSRTGEARWLDLSTSLIDYENRVASLGAALDITDRKRTEMALLDTQQRLQLAILGADLGVWDWNVATGEVNYSDRWVTMLGYKPGELAPHYLTWETLVHPDDKPRVLAVLREHHEGRDPYYEVEHRLRCKNGEWKWVLASGRVVERDDSGRPVRMTGTHLDISDRKSAEEMARQHHEQMAHVSRVSTVGEMASGLAHELAQPLSAILYYARGCLARVGSGAWGLTETREALQKIATQAERAAEFIRRIKAFVRNTAPVRGPADVNTIVRDALTLAEPLARQNHVTLELDLTPNLPSVVVDSIQIEQVVLNLIRNGVEAMRDLPPHRRRLRITTRRESDGFLHVSVTDTGPGLRAEVAARVFEPFFTTKPGGTGLGLSISRSIVEAHEGTLQVVAAEPQGTRVEFTLPIPAREVSHVGS